VGLPSEGLSKDFIVERDHRIFGLRKSGLSNQDIGRRFNMSASAVAAACRRVLKRLNSEAYLSYPEVLRLELERLDELQKSLWPKTQFRREVLDDGSEVMVEPDERSVQTVLGIMDRRAKLLGMNVERSEVAISNLTSEAVEVQSSLAGAVEVSVVSGDARAESLELLELMSASGVLDAGVVNNILDNVSSEADVIDAEVVDVLDESEGSDV